MSFWCISADFKKSQLETRAKLASKGSEIVEAVAPLSVERVWVSTCNRVELYGVGECIPSEIIKRWCGFLGLPESAEKDFNIYEEEEALLHLFRVVSSIESMVIGESQVAGQVKRAYQNASQKGLVGPTLHRAFQDAFKVAKKVRSQTEVGRLAVSIPSIGVKLAHQILGRLTNHTVGIIGLGEIGKLAAEHFASVVPKKLFLYNRTEAVAREVARNMQGNKTEVEAVSCLDSILKEANVIVSAAGAMVLNELSLKCLDGRGDSIFILDLSVPPSVADYQSKHLYQFSIDDLQKISEENNTLRSQEMKKAEDLIDSEVASCWKNLSLAGFSETFERLANKAQGFTAKELDHLKSKVPNISDEHWSEVEKMAHRLSSKCLQDPMLELKQQVQRSGDSESFLRFFRNVFRI